MNRRISPNLKSNWNAKERGVILKKWLISALAVSVFFVAGCSGVLEKGLDSVTTDKGGLKAAAVKESQAVAVSPVIPTAEMVEEAQGLPNEYRSREFGFSFRYPENWGEIEVDEGIVSISRLEKGLDLSGANVNFILMDTDPTDKDFSADAFSLIMQSVLRSEGFERIKVVEAQKVPWKEGEVFFLEYEAKVDGLEFNILQYFYDDGEKLYIFTATIFADSKQIVDVKKEFHQIRSSFWVSFN